MPEFSPEQQARQQINAMLTVADWCVQDYRNFNSGAGHSTAPLKPNNRTALARDASLPPLAKQTRMVAEVERRLSMVEELEAVVSANLQRATRLRQSVLHEAFRGDFEKST